MRRRMFIAWSFLALASAHAASTDVHGRYAVSFARVSSNCASGRSELPASGPVTIAGRDGRLVVEIAGIPPMVGAPSEHGVVKARSASATSVQGRSGSFDIDGRVAEGQLSAVLVAEYSHAGEPICTASWNLGGSVQEEAVSPP